MVKIVDKQSAFNNGILTNKLRGRDDMDQYKAAVSDALNFYASKYGPIIKRPGTKFVWDAQNDGKKMMLIPFIYSINQCVILEFLDRQIRFYTFNGTEFGAIADPANPSQQYTIATPFTENQLEHISYVQSLDVIYLAIPGGKTSPKELRRHANNNWELIDFTFEDGPYLDQNYNENMKVRVSATTTGSATLTTTGFTLSASDVGRHIRINHIDDDTNKDRWGWGVITAVTGSNTATVNIKQKVWATTDTSDFRLGAWGSGQGWPTLVTIHEQRLIWSGITNYPWLWASNSFNYHNYSPSDYEGVVKDSNAIYYNMSTDKVAQVTWMASLTGALIIGTEMYEMRMYGSGAGIAPGDCVVRKESTYGAHNAMPVLSDDTLIFVQRLQRTLRAIAYDYARDAYVGPALSTLAESLTVQGIKKIVHQREPYDLIWCLMEDGKLLAVTYDKEQNVVGWTRVEVAGKDAKVIDITSVPSTAYKQDMLIMWVERVINGRTKRYIEILSQELQDNVALNDVPFLDSAMYYEGADTLVISGLDHLEGEIVRVLDRGALHQDALVTNGSVTLKYPVAKGWIGLPYDAFFETLERDFGDKQISTKMSKVRIHHMLLYVLRTLGLTVTEQARGVTTELLTFSPLGRMDTPPEPLSGEVEHDVMTAWTNTLDLRYTLKFESEHGMPCTVAGVYTGIEMNAL